MVYRTVDPFMPIIENLLIGLFTIVLITTPLIILFTWYKLTKGKVIGKTFRRFLLIVGIIALIFQYWLVKALLF